VNRAEREQTIAEALAWMQEDGGKFPGWAVDPTVDRVVFDSSLIIYPEMKLIPALADFRARWFSKGKASPKIWRGRFRRWLQAGARRGDPLVIGRLGNSERGVGLEG